MLQNNQEDITKNYCTFYIVRHGETDWNVQKLMQGHTDIPLNETGEQQARYIAKELAHVKFDKVYSSDLLRAKRTAEVIALEHGLHTQTTKLLRERYLGPYEGKPAQVMRAFDAVYEKLTQAQKFKHKFHEDAESDEEVVGRFITFIREAAIAHAGKTILIATHSGMMRTLLIHMGFLIFTDHSRTEIKNVAYIKILSDGIEFIMQETKHITPSLSSK